jgi:hypothetical protein
MSNRIGTVFVELDLDPKRYTKGQQQLYKDATSTSLSIEANFKKMGIKSSAEFDLMRQKITNSLNMIKHSAQATANDRVRAEKAAMDQIRRINEQQYGRQVSLAEQMKKNWMGLTAAVGVVTIAYRKISSVMQESIRLANEQALQELKLGAVLKSTGFSAGYTADQLKRMAAEFQKTTNFGDEMTLSGMAILATFKQVRGEAFEKATKAAMDMSVIMGQDLKSSIVQVGKALNDPTVGLTALGRVGVTFTQQQKDMIKSLQASGDIMGAQKIILSELQSQFSGAAEAARDADKGITALKNAYGDLLEQIGKTDSYKGMVSGLTGAIQDVTGFMADPRTLEAENLSKRIAAASRQIEMSKGDRHAGRRDQLEKVINDLLEKRNDILKEINKERADADKKAKAEMDAAREAAEIVAAEEQAIIDKQKAHEALVKQIEDFNKEQFQNIGAEIKLNEKLNDAKLKAVEEEFQFRRKMYKAEQAELKKIADGLDLFFTFDPNDIEEEIKDVENIWDTAIENIQGGFADMFKNVFTGAANDFESIFTGVTDSIANLFAQQLSAQMMTGLQGGKFDWGGMAQNAVGGFAVGMLSQGISKHFGSDSAAKREQERLRKAMEDMVAALHSNTDALVQRASGVAASPYASDASTQAAARDAAIDALMAMPQSACFFRGLSGKSGVGGEIAGAGQWRGMKSAGDWQGMQDLIGERIADVSRRLEHANVFNEGELQAQLNNLTRVYDTLTSITGEYTEGMDAIATLASQDVARMLAENDYALRVSAGEISPMQQALDAVNREYADQRSTLISLDATTGDLIRHEQQRIETLRLTAQAYHAEAVASAQAGYNTAVQGELQRAQEAQAALEQRAADAKGAYVAALQERAAAEKSMMDAQAAGVQAQAKAVGDLADQSARMVETFRELADKIRDYRSSLLTSDTMIDPMTRYKVANREFETAMRDMYSGGAATKAAAIEKLPELSDKLLELSRATGGAYQQDMARVLTALNTAEGMAGTGRSTAEQQLDSLLAQQATLETQAQMMGEQVGVYQRMLDGLDRDEQDTRSFEEIQQDYWSSQEALNNSNFQTEIDFWQAEVNRMDLLINGQTSVDQATRYYGQALLSAIQAGADTDGAMAAQANAIGVSPAETAYWAAMGAAVREGVQSGAITDFQRAGGASFAGGGTVSGPSGGYMIPTTFHGIEHITPDSEMSDVKRILAEVKTVLEEIRNTSGAQNLTGIKALRILDNVTQGQTYIQTKEVA